MSGRQLVRLAIGLGVLLLLWGAAALARRHEGASGSEGFALPRIDSAAVDTVRIARASDTSVLARSRRGPDSARWRVNGHAASSTAVGELLAALADTGYSSELVAEQPGSHGGLGVDSAGGTRVRVVSRDTVLAELVAGNQTPDMEGGYLRKEGDPAVYQVRSRLPELLARSTDDWRDRRIAAVAPDSVRGIEITRRSRSYSLRRGDKGWTFGSGTGRPADSTVVAGLLSDYGQLDADGFATSAQADSARFNPPDRRVRLLRADGTPLLVLALDSAATGFWLRADSGSTVYRMDTWNAERIAPADSTVRRPRR